MPLSKAPLAWRLPHIIRLRAQMVLSLWGWHVAMANC
jgi:hypothetical protein